MAARSPRPASRRAATDPYGRLPPDVRAPGSYTEVPPTMDPAAPIGVVGTGYVGLVDGHVALLKALDLRRVDVHAHQLMAEMRETDRRDEPDVACADNADRGGVIPVSYTHLRAHETGRNLVCRL